MERFSLEPTFNVYRSEKYDNIYTLFVDKKKIFLNRAEMFTFLAIVGYKNGRRTPIDKKSTEMRSEHIKPKELVPLMTIMFNEFDNDFSKFENYDLVKEKMGIIQEYAEGGMDILCEKAFDGFWDGRSLKEDYDEYEIDIARFVYDELENINMDL